MCVYILFLQLNHFQINYESHDIAALNTLLHTSKNRHSFSWRTIVLLSHLTKITLVFLILIQYSVDTQIFQGFPHTQKNVLYNFLSDQQPVKNLLLHDVSCFFYVNNFLHYHSYPPFKKNFPHSSLAALHAFSITMELGFLLEPPAAALGSILCRMALGPTIEHLAPGPGGEWGLGTHSPISSLSSFSSSDLAEEGF